MKLLLTSDGITNDSIAKALFDLVGKKPEDTRLCYIPTASNVLKEDKKWLISHLLRLKELNFKSINFADISAIDKEFWLPQMEESDILFFEGGSSYHLMNWINKSGLNSVLPNLLKDKVYVGLSAGSMVTGKDLAFRMRFSLYEKDSVKIENIKCLNFVNFYFLPHLNSPHLKVRKENFIRKITEGMKDRIYVLDDNSALKIIDGKVEPISEGKWFAIN